MLMSEDRRAQVRRIWREYLLLKLLDHDVVGRRQLLEVVAVKVGDAVEHVLHVIQSVSPVGCYREEEP